MELSGSMCAKNSNGKVIGDVADHPQNQDKLHFGGYRYDEKRKCLVSGTGEEKRLRAQSLAVFVELASASNQIVSRMQLTEKIWPDVHVTDDSISKCISEIRKAISDRDRTILKTVPRQGYMLVADKSSIPESSIPESSIPESSIAESSIPESSTRGNKTTGRRRVVLTAIGIFALAGLFLLKAIRSEHQNPTQASAISGTPTVKLINEANAESGGFSDRVLPELRVELSRYRTVDLSGSDNTDYLINIADTAEDRLSVELINNASSVVYAQTYDETVSLSTRQTAQRIAASIASPGVGALDRELLRSSRLKPVDTLTHAECFAHGFGCSKCSGEEDNITKRAEACLAHVIENEPENARALALQATIHAHQYWWGNTLPEPLRSHLKLREHLPELAIEAANKAEALSVGDDSAIYWGMTEAYYSSCQTDKMSASIQRGLEINPNDPNLLAAFGNWLSYSGRWDEGAELTQRALDIEPQHYRKWWWMGLAKTHYFKEEFQAAYDDFLKSFNDRNWVSHLQFAYTLPHLGRMEDARQAVERLQDLVPQMTIEKALEHYEILCFPDSFLKNMKLGLERAGLPSRGNSDTFSEIVLPRAKIMELDGYRSEYIDYGEGEAVVFVHGSLSDYRSWGFYLVPMSENHRFITYSRRYHGTQDWVDEGQEYTSKKHASDLIDFVESLNAGQVHLVSWSTGVIAAMLATIERPDLFKSAIHYEPVDVAIFSDQSLDDDKLAEWEEPWSEVYELLENNDPEMATQRFVELVFDSGPGGYTNEREHLKEVFRQNARTLKLEEGEPFETRWTLTCDEVSRNTVPSLFVQGSLSDYFFTKQTELFAECSGGELVTLEGVNHRGAIDAVLPITELVTEFVARHK